VLAHIRPLFEWFVLKLDISFVYTVSPTLCLVSVSFKCPPFTESPFARSRCYLLRCHVYARHQRALPLLHSSYWLMRRPNPSCRLGLNLVRQVFVDCCKSLLGRWPFPTLSLQSLRRCLDPYPAVSFKCTCPLLPGRQRPHLKRHRFGTPKILPAMQLQQGSASRGCSHSVMFRLPRSLDPQIAPTAEALSLQGSRAVYTTHSSVGCLPRDVASLRIRHEQLIRLVFHQLDCSLVGRSDVRAERAHERH